MLEKIKVLLSLDDNTKDDLLTILIDQASDEALAFTHRASVDELDTSIIQMVVYKYNRIGTEGVESENYNGASFNYSPDYPEYIMRGLRAKRKVVVL